MYSSELLYKIVKTNNCYRKKNLRTIFSSDPSSAKNTLKLKDCSFLNKNRVYVGKCQEACQVKITKVVLKRHAGKKSKGCVRQNFSENTVSICKVRTNKRSLGERVNRMRSVCNGIKKCCKKN
jgi:hypothetical protein